MVAFRTCNNKLRAQEGPADIVKVCLGLFRMSKPPKSDEPSRVDQQYRWEDVRTKVTRLS